MVGLKLLCVMAKFRKLCGTRDNGWLCGRGGNCGAVGVVSFFQKSNCLWYGFVFRLEPDLNYIL